jgi:hypothetical protein
VPAVWYVSVYAASPTVTNITRVNPERLFDRYSGLLTLALYIFAGQNAHNHQVLSTQFEWEGMKGSIRFRMKLHHSLPRYRQPVICPFYWIIPLVSCSAASCRSAEQT